MQIHVLGYTDHGVVTPVRQADAASAHAHALMGLSDLEELPRWTDWIVNTLA